MVIEVTVILVQDLIDEFCNVRFGGRNRHEETHLFPTEIFGKGSAGEQNTHVVRTALQR